MNKKQKIILIVVIIAIAAALVAVVGVKKFGGSGKTKEMVYVESVQDIMNRGAAGVENRYAGVVESQDTWDVTLNEGQIVKELYVEVGDDVQVDTPLFEYNTDDMNLQLSQLKLELESIGNEISGYNSQIKTLTAEKATVSKDDQFSYTVQIQSLQTSIKQAEYNQKSKQMEIDKLQNAINQSVVTSKIAGVVKEINEPGSIDEYGNPKPYLSVLTTGDYRVKGTVAETNVWLLEEGQSVIIRSRVDENMVWMGTLDSVDTENQETNNNNMYMMDSGSSNSATKYPFYVNLDTIEGLMLGQHVFIELDNGQTVDKEGIWLDSSYIVQQSMFDGLSAEAEMEPYVWADNGNGRLEKRVVELGEYDLNTDMYQILSGLTEEDLIAWPQEGLKEGMRTTTNAEEAYIEAEYDEGDMMLSGDEEYFDDSMMDEPMVDEEFSFDSEEEIMSDGEFVQDGTFVEDGADGTAEPDMAR